MPIIKIILIIRNMKLPLMNWPQNWTAFSQLRFSQSNSV